MANVGHSTLLKYFVDTTKMSEIKKSIESKVPGEQVLREGSPDVHSEENASNSSENNVENQAIVKEDCVYSPVITVTKEETTLTKGDLKLQKVVVSEDISDDSPTVNTTVSIEEATGPHSVHSKIWTEVNIISGDVGEKDKNIEDTKTERDEQNNKKTTKIPKFRLKQAFDKLKKQEQISQEKIVQEPLFVTKTKSAIPRLKNAKQPENNQKDLSENEENQESPQLDDEFDKIYEEIIEKDAFNNNIPTPEKIQELEKVDSKFEEIIHSYDEKNVQTVVTEKVKSKIPMLKRKSEQEIEIPPQFRKHSLKKSLSVDDKGKIPMIKSKEKTIKTEKERSKATIKGLSESHFEVKSVGDSAEISKSVTTVTKTISSHKIIESEQINISSKEENKIHVAKTAEDEENSKGMPKCKIPLPQHTKEKLKNQTQESIVFKTVEKETFSNVEVSLDGKSEVKSAERTELVQETESGSATQKDTKIHTSFNEEFFDQSSHSTENTTVKTSNSAKITEISNINVETQNHVTSQIRETVKVATLNYETIFGSEFQTLNKNIKEDKTNESSDMITEDHKITTISSIDSDRETGENKIFIQEETQNHIQSSSIKSPKDNYMMENEKYKNVIVTESENVEPIEEESNETEIKNNTTLEKKITNTRTSVKSFDNTDSIIQGVNNKGLDAEITLMLNTSSEKVIAVINKENSYKHDNQQSIKKIETSGIDDNSETMKSNEVILKNNLPNNDFEKANMIDVKTLNSNISSQVKNIDDLEEEDIIALKGKVNRIISRLDSREQKINKTEVDDVPVDVSVTSKIAIFEKPETINNNTEDNVDNKPKIVEELLKTPANKLGINPNTNNETDNISKYNINIPTNTADENSLDYNFFNKKQKNDYYTTYNRVHSSVINRLNSIETRFKNTKDEKLVTESANECTTVDDKITEINNSKALDKSDDTRVKNKNELKIFTYEKNNEVNNEVFTKNNENIDKFKEYRPKTNLDPNRRAKSLAELDLGDAVKGRVRQMVFRMNSMEKMRFMRRDTVEMKERLRKGSVTNRVALFEMSAVPEHTKDGSSTSKKSAEVQIPTISEEQLQEKIAELTNAKLKYGKWENMTSLELKDGSTMPVLVVGTALLEPKLIKHIITAAIDLGYRAIDTAYIYGNEKQIGEAIRSKIEDGTVKREDLYIISKLWSTYHRRDLVEKACKRSLEIMGLDYFDIYIIHNPMSFKEGDNPLPKIANVLQYSNHDYLDAWYGIEDLIHKGLVKRGGISNFNSVQVKRVVDKGKIKPVLNQVESHPYLTQQRLDEFCSAHNVKLCCFGILGSKSTPLELKSGLPPVIDDPLVKVMSAGLGVTPAQLLIAFQLQTGRSVVVKSSSASHLWNNLQALNVKLGQSQISALNMLNRNKRTFTFVGMGDTHRNYPFNIPF